MVPHPPHVTPGKAARAEGEDRRLVAFTRHELRVALEVHGEYDCRGMAALVETVASDTRSGRSRR